MLLLKVPVCRLSFHKLFGLVLGKSLLAVKKTSPTAFWLYMLYLCACTLYRPHPTAVIQTRLTRWSCKQCGRYRCENSLVLIDGERRFGYYTITGYKDRRTLVLIIKWNNFISENAFCESSAIAFHILQ
jgi:hypothetical protein